MASYRDAFKGLNEAQKLAVTTVDGPVLVIAGPGTGKTQLLTTRIAHILATTDTLPQNILCLTFTESAAQTMRERLSTMIGQAAYDITISTYHAFGSDLIRRFPDYFTELSGQQAVDDLGIDTIFREILEALPYSNPLKFADMYLRDLKTFVSDAKRTLLTPEDILAVAEHNLAFIAAAQPMISKTLGKISRIDKKSIPLFTELASNIMSLAEEPSPKERIQPLSRLFIEDLSEAVAAADETGKTNTITAWKNTWLAKDGAGNFIIDGQKSTQKLQAAANVYQHYLNELSARGLFDYDDMILRAVKALENNTNLRYTLQEQYLYILLDEFQDTNGAQLRLVELLTDNPVSEGQPNVLAVGDDDQAIYAFQGANYSHMLQFQQRYRDVLVVPLTKNYRSHAAILQASRGIAEQIEERLHHHFPEIEKTLTAENSTLPAKAIVERREAKSDVGQFSWTARKIKELIGRGIPASEIAVLAPQHKYLEPLVPFLQDINVPVRYEKRENILDDQAIIQLQRMSELVLALSKGHHKVANALWSEVLSYPFWELPTSLIWKLSWQTSDNREDWTETLLGNTDVKPIALFFIRLSMYIGSETLETMLDYLIGVTPLDLKEPDHSTYTSPFYDHYFGHTAALLHDDSSQIKLLPDENELAEARTESSDFWQLLTSLTVLRTRLREYRANDGEPLRLADFVQFIAAHRAANIKVLNTSPYQEAAEAVQLMTAFKAKGMEFTAVFVLAANDEAWGSKARSQSTRLPLPANLQFIRYAGATNDERLRLFYVALTRAKTELYIVNYVSNYAGKVMSRLRYLSEQTDENGVGVSPLLPENQRTILTADDGFVQPTTELAAYWQQRHEAGLTHADLQVLLAHRLERFQLSPTHVNSFINLDYQGPAFFFMNTILRFPRAPIPAGEFGNAIHETLEWIHLYNRKQGNVPAEKLMLEIFEKNMRSKNLNELDTTQFVERGMTALRAYHAQRSATIDASNEVEFNFRNEGVFIGEAHMAGKVDKLIIDKSARTIAIVDYKTGRSFARWQHDAKLYRYKQQLYLYRALVEGSHTFAGYKVTDAYLEFVEPDEDGKINELHLAFDDAEYAEARKLAEVVWRCIKTITIPDTSQYTHDLKGILAFENDLLSNE